MSMTSDTRHIGGFTLLEVMVSVALIATAFASLLTLQRQTVAAHSKIRSITVASMIAEDRMERIILRAQGYEQILELNEELDRRFPDYEVEATVEDISPEELPVVMFLPADMTLKTVRVIVSWQEGANTRTYELQRYVTQKLT